MRCPRCQRASPDEAVFCPGCGAPLALPAEPAPRRLDLSISLDRRAGGREASLDPPREAAHAAAWDLRGPLGPAPSSSAAFEPAEDDDLEFGPIPELASDPDPGPGPALAEDPVGPSCAPEPRFDAPTLAARRPLSRALGLAPDPVEPDDLGLAPPAEAPDLALRSATPRGSLDHDLDLDGDLGPGPDRVLARGADLGLGRGRGLGHDLDRELERSLDQRSDRRLERSPRLDPDLGLDHDRGPDLDLDHDLDLGHDLDRGVDRASGPDRGPDLDRDLDLDLTLNVPGQPEAQRELDLSLPLVAEPDQLPLPLRDVGPRLRNARPARRAAAWAVDAVPLVLLWVAGLAALYEGVPLSPGDHAGLLERVVRDGGAIALPLAAVVSTLALVHQTLAHALAGATLGKWLLGLRVVSEDGERPSVSRCAARAAMSAASVLLLGLGLLPALFTGSGRALHDISAGTRVVESP